MRKTRKNSARKALPRAKGIKKAVGDFNSWVGSARVYYDSEDNTVWTNIYHSDGDYNRYESKSISQVHRKTFPTQFSKITMKELQAMINEL